MLCWRLSTGARIILLKSHFTSVIVCFVCFSYVFWPSVLCQSRHLDSMYFVFITTSRVCSNSVPGQPNLLNGTSVRAVAIFRFTLSKVLWPQTSQCSCTLSLVKRRGQVLNSLYNGLGYHHLPFPLPPLDRPVLPRAKKAISAPKSQYITFRPMQTKSEEQAQRSSQLIPPALTSTIHTHMLNWGAHSSGLLR